MEGNRPRELLQAILETVESSEDERARMDEADRYYEGDQLTKDVIERRTGLGLPNPTTTLVTEAMDSVHGQEIKRRTDTQVLPNTEDDNDMAEAVNFLLRQQEEVVNAHIIDSEAYEGITTPGIGWVYVGNSDNPLKVGVQVTNVERDDVITDRRGVKLDGSDCEWRVWRRFMTADAAKMILPKHADLIDHVSDSGTLQTPFLRGGYSDTKLARNYARHFHRRDQKNSELALFVVWYRDYAKRTLLIKGDSVQIYDETNIEHVTMLEDMEVMIQHAHVPIMREAWFVGPYLAEDMDSPHPHNEFPLVEARGYMKKKSHRRYGLLEHAIGPQDEYNLLCTKIAEILVSKRIMWEEGAFGIGPHALKPEQVRDEFARRDTAIQLPKGGLDKVRVEQDWAELSTIVGLKETAREQVRIAMGVNFSMTGQQEGQQSGTAIASLAELSMTTMGKLNSNYEFYRKQRAWLQVAHIIHQIGDREHDVNIEDESGKRIKTITLNKRDGYGVSNKLSLSKLRIKLKHISTSQGHKAFNHQRLTELHNNTDDDIARRILMPAILKQSDVPDADEMVEEYYKAIGQSDDPAAQEEAAKKKQIEDKMIQLEMDEKQAEIDLKKAQAAKARADANAPQQAQPNRKPDLIKQLRQVTANNQLNQGRTLQ